MDVVATYDEITALCSARDAGAPAVPAVAAFVDERSTAVTAAPMAGVAATRTGIQGPDHHATTLEVAQMLAPGMDLSDAPSFDRVP
ncbi:UNVERIFIED_CONTAM: hypothetical protein RF653_05285 [Kocuria sp. CPCC 205316]|uniref:hypothetical protein n=1 Tax=Kocuria TaxID=57493 RepID=UPI0036D889DB